MWFHLEMIIEGNLNTVAHTDMFGIRQFIYNHSAPTNTDNNRNLWQSTSDMKYK